MSAEADRIRTLLDDDDTGGDDGPTGRAVRRRQRARGSLLSTLETRLRTMVSLKKQRFVKDGLNLDLAYVGPRIIAFGYPSVGKEAMFRNPYPEVLDFFKRYHAGRKYKVYNLCSERAYPPSYFGGRFERFPFDDHNPSPLALIPPFVDDARAFMALDPENVVAVHCKAGKGRTGMMVCCLLLAMETCTTSKEAQEYFAKHRTQDGKGVQIPSQRRFIGYYSQMLRTYSGNPPPAPPIRLSCFILSTTPRFDPDGGCDPFVVVSRRRAGHRHVPLGQSEANVHAPLEVLFDSRKLSPPQHIVKQKDFRLATRDIWLPGGELRFELFDEDKLSKSDIMASFWVHTGFLPLDGAIKFSKEELDDAVKDKKHELIDSDFVLTMKYRFAEAKANAASSKAPTNGAAKQPPPQSSSSPPATSAGIGRSDFGDI
jgi:phosphatidylinositol-3,4,5-trisphosphate 3-phosphatase/dual-specificity protein phosphatase PTEN